MSEQEKTTSKATQKPDTAKAEGAKADPAPKTTTSDDARDAAAPKGSEARPQAVDAAADLAAKETELATLKARLAELEGARGASPAPPPALTEENAKDPVLVRVKHGTFVGSVDGNVFTDAKPAQPGTKFKIDRAHAYRMAKHGSLELL